MYRHQDSQINQIAFEMFSLQETYSWGPLGKTVSSSQLKGDYKKNWTVTNWRMCLDDKNVFNMLLS